MFYFHAFWGQFAHFFNLILVRNLLGRRWVCWPFGRLEPPAFWITCLIMAAKFHFEILKTTKGWKYFKLMTKRERKYIGKFRKFCKPVYLGTPGLFRIKKVTILKFIQGIVRGAFRGLVTMKSM